MSTKPPKPQVQVTANTHKRLSDAAHRSGEHVSVYLDGLIRKALDAADRERDAAEDNAAAIQRCDCEARMAGECMCGAWSTP